MIDFDLKALIEGISVTFVVRCEQKRLGWRVEWGNERRGEEEKRERGEKEKERVGESAFRLQASRILVHVVDDIAENRQVLSQLLESIGVEVTTVESGQQAIEAVRVKSSSDCAYGRSHASYGWQGGGESDLGGIWSNFFPNPFPRSLSYFCD